MPHDGALTYGLINRVPPELRSPPARASVAATGSEIGVLELAAEDELKPPQTKRPRLDRRNRRKAYSSSDKPRNKDRGSSSKKCSKPRQSDGFRFNRHLPQSRRSSCRTLRECRDEKRRRTIPQPRASIQIAHGSAQGNRVKKSVTTG